MKLLGLEEILDNYHEEIYGFVYVGIFYMA